MPRIFPGRELHRDREAHGLGGGVLSAADLERQLLVGASQSSDGQTSPDCLLADDVEWQNLPEDPIKELELILGQLIDYAPSLQASGAVQRQTEGHDGGLGPEDKVYGVKLRDLLKLLVHAVRGRLSGVAMCTDILQCAS